MRVDRRFVSVLIVCAVAITRFAFRSRYLYDRFRNFDHCQVVQSSLQVHNASAVCGFGFNLLCESRDKG